MFVKPANLGSSVGISKAHNFAELETALQLAAQFDRKIIVERAIVGQELECAVLGNDKPIAATPCEILPSREFYDYEDKYLLDQAKIELPARISPEKTEELRRLAVECYLAVECSGMARVDFLLESATGRLYINEINTIPGFTSISMYPKMWEHSGLPMPKLIDRLIELALERHAAKKAHQVHAMKFRFTAALLFLFLPAVCADDLETQVKRFVDAYATVEREAADPVPPEKAFYEGAIPGLLRRLDPHSVFFDPGQFEQLKKMETSTQKGFGTVVSILPGRIIVLQTLPGTPSAKSGMAPGDEILAINGYAVDRLDMDQMIQLLTQSRQQPARLVIRRPGNARVLDFVLTPEEMQAPSVDRAFHLKPGVGYLRVSSFDEKTGEQIKEAIEKLGGANLKGLVLDLRNNPGGLLPAALYTSALFLEPGQKILSVRGRKVEEQDQTVPPGSMPYVFPMAVLINAKSASASEIVSGALQDHDRAAIIGEPSYGKGLVQSVFPLSDSTGMALTTALYYTPSGRSIQRPLKGAEFALSATASHPNKQSEFRTDSGRVVKGGGGIQPDYEVYPEAPTRLRAVLEASGLFTTFAIDYVGKHPGIPQDFEVSGPLLDDFQLFLSQRNIQPGVADWSRDRDIIRNRLKTEIFNQAFGVEKGDEVEAQRDALIQKALEVIGHR